MRISIMYMMFIIYKDLLGAHTVLPIFTTTSRSRFSQSLYSLIKYFYKMYQYLQCKIYSIGIFINYSFKLYVFSINNIDIFPIFFYELNNV
jgi:hypothetical protein